MWEIIYGINKIRVIVWCGIGLSLTMLGSIVRNSNVIELGLGIVIGSAFGGLHIGKTATEGAADRGSSE